MEENGKEAITFKGGHKCCIILISLAHISLMKTSLIYLHLTVREAGKLNSTKILLQGNTEDMIKIDFS